MKSLLSSLSPNLIYSIQEWLFLVLICNTYTLNKIIKYKIKIINTQIEEKFEETCQSLYTIRII